MDNVASTRVLRGGSFYDGEPERVAFFPDNRYGHSGFRLVLTPPDPTALRVVFRLVITAPSNDNEGV